LHRLITDIESTLSSLYAQNTPSRDTPLPKLRESALELHREAEHILQTLGQPMPPQSCPKHIPSSSSSVQCTCHIRLGSHADITRHLTALRKALLNASNRLPVPNHPQDRQLNDRLHLDSKYQDRHSQDRQYLDKNIDKAREDKYLRPSPQDHFNNIQSRLLSLQSKLNNENIPPNAVQSRLDSIHSEHTLPKHPLIDLSSPPVQVPRRIKSKSKSKNRAHPSPPPVPSPQPLPRRRVVLHPQTITQLSPPPRVPSVCTPSIPAMSTAPSLSPVPLASFASHSPRSSKSFGQSFRQKSDHSSNPKPAQVSTACSRFVKRVDTPSTQGTVTVLKIIEEKTVVAGYSNGDLLFFDVSTNYVPICAFNVHQGAVCTLELAYLEYSSSEEGVNKNCLMLFSASVGPDCSIAVWDAHSYELLRRLSGHDSMVTAIRDLGDGSTVVTASTDSKIAVWNTSNSFECTKLFEENHSAVYCLDYNSEDNMLASGGQDGTILIWRIFFYNEKFGSSCLLHTMSVGGAVLELSLSSTLRKGLFVLTSDYILRVFERGDSHPKFAYKSSRPILDFFVVESQSEKEDMADSSEQSIPVVFGVDDKYVVHKLSEAAKTMENFQSLANFSSYEPYPPGFGPISQLLVSPNGLQLLAAEHGTKNLLINEICIE